MGGGGEIRGLIPRGHPTRKAASTSTWLFGNRTGVRWLAAWMAATVVWGVSRHTLDAQLAAPLAGTTFLARGRSV